MIAQRILSFFVIMGLGYAARKARVVDAAFSRRLSGFIMDFALPFAIVASLDRSIPRDALPELGFMLLLSIAVHGGMILFANFAFTRVPEAERRVLMFLTVFTNCAFMGFPITQTVLGAKGLMFASMYNLVFVLLVRSWGAAVFRPGAARLDIKGLLLNPINVAVAAGLAIWLAPWELPAFAREAIQLMSALQTPLSMFVVGAAIAGVPLRGMFRGRWLWLSVPLRLLVLPAALFGLFRIAGFTGTAPAVTVLLLAMPAGSLTVVQAELGGGDVEFASRTVFVSTVLSIFTIPIFATLVA